MELAGLKVVMDADFDALYANVDRAYRDLGNFAKDIKNMFSSIPDLGKRFKFTSSGASQATQDAYNTAKAKTEEAKARYFNARASNVEEKATASQSKSTKKQIDEYGVLVKESNELVRAYYNASTQVLKYGDAAGISAQQLEEMRLAALKGQEQLKQIEAGAGRFQRNVGNYSGALEPLQFSIAQITREMPAFANSLQTGFMGISNNIGPAIDAFQRFLKEQKDLAAQGKPSKTALQGLSAAFLSWNTALSVGITLLTVYGPQIVEMIKGTKEADKATKEYADSIRKAGIEARSQAEEEVNKLNILIKVAQSNKQAISERRSAVSELQKIYPEYFKNLSTEQIMYSDLSSVIGQVTSALYKNAIAKAYASKANIAADRYVEESEKLREVNKQLKEYYDNNKDVINQQSKRAQEVANQASNSRSSGIIGATRELAQFNELNKQSTEAAKNAYNAQREIEKFQTLAAENSVNVDGLFGGKGSEKAKKSAKEVKTYADALKELTASLDEADRKERGGLYTEKVDYYNDLAEAYKKFIVLATSKEIKDPLTLESTQIQDYIGKLGDVNKMILQLEESAKKTKSFADIDKNISEGLLKNSLDSKDGLERIRKDIDLYKQAIVELTLIDPNTSKLKELNEILGMMAEDEKAAVSAQKVKEFGDAMNLIQRKLGVGMISNAEATKEEIQLLNKQLETAIKNGNIISQIVFKYQIDTKKAQEDLNQLNTSLSDLIQGTITNGAIAIGESLGNIISGFDITTAMAPIFNLVADSLRRLGELMLLYGTALEGIEEGIRGMNPYVAIAAGIAAITTAAIIKNTMNKGNKGVNFASGGIVYGETFARVGEYSNSRGNPEIIAPLDKLKNILQSEGIGSNMQPIILNPEVKLYGQDLLLSIKRAEKGFNR